MIKACLFDLDGTLLPLDTDQFVETYLKALAPYVAHIIPPDKLVPAIWKATMAMIESNDGNLTNEQVFEQEFLRLTGLKREEIWPAFDRFYEIEFPKLRDYAGHNPAARQAVQAALDQGYKVAVATNPVFPKTAILERMRWAGVDDLPFEWVTVYEETHYCKPRPEYYLEVAEYLSVKPQECVMVGNDMQEDMVASTVGMNTFYLTEYRIDRGKPVYPVDQEGSLSDLIDLICKGRGFFEKKSIVK
ncbi:HAD family hydrolase [Paenactinomyces guangxiensis]|uniref:HAD family hydrolase n=1 Tax=Paenactinomyces guangxiensis TaxID=1490290 RepID=UPI001E63CE2F|nr:HAD family hydrolase [Paenactinomyces guangxiensis]